MNSKGEWERSDSCDLNAALQQGKTIKVMAVKDAA